MDKRVAKTSRDVRCLLLCRLQALTYLAFLLCVMRVLERAGYADVDWLERLHTRGRNSQGGADLKGAAQVGFSTGMVLIQAKQGRADRRFVDELRGAMLRHGAPFGILVSLDELPQQAIAAAALYRGRPVRLVGGEELASTMMVLGIGVRAPLSAGTAACHQTVNEGFFRSLEREAVELIEKRQQVSKQL